MHDSAYRIGELVMQTYCDLPNARILEIGSMDVNGSLRDAAAPTTRYVGLDLEAGKGVDVVIQPGEELPFDDNSFDLIMASSAFEHDPRFWETFGEMCRVAQPGGHIYVNVPSNGGVHRYPLDCWRFYPDAGIALVSYAEAQGIDIQLVESFVGRKSSDAWDGWNDFVAIFRKGPSKVPLNRDFVYKRYPSNNARTWDSPTLFFEDSAPEDMQRVRDLRQQFAEQEGRLSGISVELANVGEKLALAENGLHQSREEIGRHLSAIDQLTSERAEAERQKEKLAGDLRISEAETGHLRSTAASLERQIEAFVTALQAQSDILARAQERDQTLIGSLQGDLAGLRAEHFDLRVEHADLRAEHTSLRTEHAGLRTEYQSHIDRASAELAHFQAREHELGAMIEAGNARRIEAETQAGARQREIEDISSRLRQAQRHQVDTEWLRAVHIALNGRPFWWHLLPAPSRRKREYGLLRRAGLFDNAAYLACHSDVAASGMDPLRHYITHGMSERRSRGLN